MIGGSVSKGPLLKGADRMNRNLESVDSKLKELINANNHNAKVLMQAILENRQEIERLRQDVQTKNRNW